MKIKRPKAGQTAVIPEVAMAASFGGYVDWPIASYAQWRSGRNGHCGSKWKVATKISM
jgi:hypothetical protein